MNTTSSRRAIALLSTVLLATAAVACGDDDDDDAASDTTAGAPLTTAAADTATTAPAGTEAPGTTGGGSDASAGGATVAAADSELGTILVDGEGMTLYVFVPDNAGPSTCVDDCIAAWPALAGPVTAGDGADEAMLGTAPRPDDGSEQATYNGWPLYHFAQDAAAGDTKGQGLGENWWVVDPATGEAISG